LENKKCLKPPTSIQLCNKPTTSNNEGRETWEGKLAQTESIVTLTWRSCLFNMYQHILGGGTTSCYLYMVTNLMDLLIPGASMESHMVDETYEMQRSSRKGNKQHPENSHTG